MNQNVTLSLPKDTLQRAKLIAVARGVSLSGLLRDLLREVVEAEDRYETARRRHLRILERGFDLGGGGQPAASREELHER